MTDSLCRKGKLADSFIPSDKVSYKNLGLSGAVI